MDNLIDISSANVGESVDSSRPLWEVPIGNYRYVLFGVNKVLVYKGDAEAPTYEITNFSCSCPGDRYNANPCKHRKAISYLGDGSPSTPPTADLGVTERPTRSRPSPQDLDSFL